MSKAVKAIINYGGIDYSIDDINEKIDSYELIETYSSILEIYDLKNYDGLELIVSKTNIYLLHSYSGDIVKVWGNLIPEYSFNDGFRLWDRQTTIELIKELLNEIFECVKMGLFLVVEKWDTKPFDRYLELCEYQNKVFNIHMPFFLKLEFSFNYSSFINSIFVKRYEQENYYHSIKKSNTKKNKKSSQVGYIYLIQNIDTKYVKIGFSVNPSNRLSTLQTGSSQPLIILKTKKGTIQQEKSLHKKYKHLHILGEWFTLSEDLLKEFN